LAIPDSEAGGLRIIASVGTDKHSAKKAMSELCKLTNKPFAVNIVLMLKNAYCNN
jgi:hypothetical protein